MNNFMIYLCSAVLSLVLYNIIKNVCSVKLFISSILKVIILHEACIIMIRGYVGHVILNSRVM